MILALARGRLEVEEDLVEADGPGRVQVEFHKTFLHAFFCAHFGMPQSLLKLTTI